jgi:hypothetical protein
MEGPVRWSWIGILCYVGALAACAEQPHKLSKDEIEMFDAVIFALNGIEENASQDHREPWKRQVIGRNIRFSAISKNSLFFGDDEMNAKTRPSSFIRYTEKISSPEACVFRRESLTEFSKGNSREEFTAYTMMGETVILNLANAYSFGIYYEYPEANVSMQGPSVACIEEGPCDNFWEKTIYEEDDWKSVEKPHSIVRRERAIALIKKTCPGKPY